MKRKHLLFKEAVCKNRISLVKLYYVFIENFQKHLVPKFINKYLNIDIKRSLQSYM